MAQARSLLERAVDCDPNYAKAMALIALTHYFDIRFNYSADKEASRQRIVELTEHHREYISKRALKATNDISARARVMIDSVCDHRVRELEQCCTSSTEEHRQISTERPRDRAGTQDPLSRIRNVTHQLR